MIYILEFDQTIGNPDKPKGQARYYLGYCKRGRLEQRLKEHRSGYGACITRFAVQNGIGFKVVVTMRGTRKKERELKNQRNTPRIVRQHLAKMRKSKKSYLSQL
jgi:predicted GIY-YIG superfamily endonuclease